MGDDVRFAIVGLGMGTNRAKVVVKTPGARLVCVCDLQEEKAKAFGEENGVEWTTSMDDLLARDDVDCVGILSPSGHHCDHAVQVLVSRAGRDAQVYPGVPLLVDGPGRLAVDLLPQLLAFQVWQGKVVPDGDGVLARPVYLE